MIRFACPSCQSAFTVGEEKAGKPGKCPKCGTQFRIPTPPGAEGPPPSPPPPSAVAAPPPPVEPSDDVEIRPCPGCGKRLLVSEGDLDQKVECPYCQRVYTAVRLDDDVPTVSPRQSRRAEDDADEERPSRRRRPRAEDAEERPSRRRDDDEDDADEEDDRPSRRKGRRLHEDDVDKSPARRRVKADVNTSRRRRGATVQPTPIAPTLLCARCCFDDPNSIAFESVLASFWRICRKSNSPAVESC